jgi:hypothetical protein
MVHAVAAQGNTCANPSGQERIVSHYTDNTYESPYPPWLSESVTLF